MNQQKFLAWLWVALCSLSIFAIVPLARAIQRFVSENFGRALFDYAVLAAVGAGFVGLVYALFIKLRIRVNVKYFSYPYGKDLSQEGGKDIFHPCGKQISHSPSE